MTIDISIVSGRVKLTPDPAGRLDSLPLGGSRRGGQDCRIYDYGAFGPMHFRLMIPYIKYSQFAGYRWLTLAPEFGADDITDPDLPPLDDWQRKAIDISDRRWRFGLAHEVGAGKTRTAIEIMARDMHSRGLNKIAIICPKKLPLTWVTQVSQWWPIDAVDMPEIYIFGSLAPHIASLPVEEAKDIKKRVHVIRDNSDMPSGPAIVIGTWLQSAKYWERLNAWAPESVVFDEAHRMGQVMSGQHKAALRLAGYAPNGPTRVLCLTGTPITQSPQSVHGCMRIIDPAALPWSKTAFGQWFEVDFKATLYAGREIRGKQFASESYREKFERIMGYNWDIVSSLPRTWDAPRYKEIDCSEPKVNNWLKELRRTSTLSAVDYTGSRFSLLVDGPAASAIRASQIANGFVGGDDTNSGERWLYAPGESPKCAKLGELLADHTDGTPVIVWHKYTPDLQNILKVCSDLGLNVGQVNGRHKDLTSTNNVPDGIDVLAIQHAAGAEGLQLDRAYLNVWMGLPYSITHWRQAIGRTDRRGQKGSPLHVILHGGWIDLANYRALLDGKDFLDEIMNNAKEIR